MLHQQGTSVGFTAQDGKFWCAEKGRACVWATTWGQCQRTACAHLDEMMKEWQIVSGSSSTPENVLPEELVINGVKYKKAD